MVLLIFSYLGCRRYVVSQLLFAYSRPFCEPVKNHVHMHSVCFKDTSSATATQLSSRTPFLAPAWFPYGNVLFRGHWLRPKSRIVWHCAHYTGREKHWWFLYSCFSTSFPVDVLYCGLGKNGTVVSIKLMHRFVAYVLSAATLRFAKRRTQILYLPDLFLFLALFLMLVCLRASILLRVLSKTNAAN